MAQSALLDSLDAVAAALEEENYGRIDAELDEYQAAYQENLSTARLTLQRSQLGRTEMDISSETQSTLIEYENQQGGTNAARAGLLAGGDILLFDPETADSSELASGVPDLREQEITLSDSMATASSVISDLDLPARVAILSATPETRNPVLGSTVGVDITVANVGDTSADDVSLSAESSLPVSPSETNIGSVAAEETETVSVDVTANEAGEHEVTFTVESANAGTESASTTVNVLTKADLLSAAIDLIDELIERFRDVSSLPGNKERSFIAKLQNVRKKIERAQRAIGRGKQKQADNALNAAINQMGAFLNELDTVKNDRAPSEAFVWSVEQSANAVIEQLARAREATLTR
jgi:hypothetical protein